MSKQTNGLVSGCVSVCVSCADISGSFGGALSGILIGATPESALNFPPAKPGRITETHSTTRK